MDDERERTTAGELPQRGPARTLRDGGGEDGNLRVVMLECAGRADGAAPAAGRDRRPGPAGRDSQRVLR